MRWLQPYGRHLAMMPYPKRCFMVWQYPWYPKEWQVEKSGPNLWLSRFQNAQDWCPYKSGKINFHGVAISMVPQRMVD
ncbi:hypothetical protein BS78_03G277600 [Paspalum vaginatum]|nr:hypothetical protein BS78_03G277600 [Paspalum vaginatum]